MLNAEFRMFSGAKTYLDLTQVERIAPLNQGTAEQRWDIKWEEGMVATQVWFRSGLATLVQATPEEIVAAVFAEHSEGRPIQVGARPDGPANGG